MTKKVVLGVILLFVFWQCNVLRKSQQPQVSITVSSPTIDSVNYDESTYQETAPTLWRLVHIDAKIHPIFATQDLIGDATLTLVTHFYPMDSLVLDARQFDIDSIVIVQPQHVSFIYDYDGRHIRIYFNKLFHKDDTLVIRITYKNNFSPVDSSGVAVAGDRGFYFINPLGKDPLMPPHAWTQGETEWNSWWLPLIDKPNQHLTQHICITVDDTSFVTLSNGTLQWTQTNPDGTRTDCWAQDKPHAAYLIFIAIGPYQVVMDTAWRGREVSYYLFPKYGALAKSIFPNTREMLSYFSKLFKYEFPWDKYSQVGVYHFTAGAMENTTSVLFGANAYKTSTDLIETTIEPIVAHELVHHWFGDLVSCESWAHLTLNESFADYGEYLWAEYKYGRDSADVAREQSLKGYIFSAKSPFGYTRPLVFFHYEQGDEMFDAHSYNKGGAILHYLRYLSGDSAFFASLSHYLKSREYSSAEVEHLRLAFEDVTGLDWRPFFMDWYYKEGHPVLNVSYHYNDSVLELVIKQTSVPTKIKPWAIKLPLLISTKTGKDVIDINISADSIVRISVPVKEPIYYAMLDPDYFLVGEISHEMPMEWKKEILSDYDIPAIARRQIMRSLVSQKGLPAYDSTTALHLVRSMLNDPFYYNRAVGLKIANKIAKGTPSISEFLYDTVKIVARFDPSFQVRKGAVEALPYTILNKDQVIEMFKTEKFPTVRLKWLEKWARVDTVNAWKSFLQWAYSDTSRIIWDNALPIVNRYFYSQEGVFQWLTTGLWTFANDYWIWTWFYYYLHTLAKAQDADLIKMGIDTLKTLTEVRIHPWNRRAITSYAKRFVSMLDEYLGDQAQDIKQYFKENFPYIKEE